MELDRAYASLPQLACQRKCQDSCGPIVFSGEERRRIERLIDQRISRLPRGGWQCPLLTAQGTCAVYTIRPMICRLWGLTKSMACPFGCVPERWLTEDEAHALLAKVEAW